MKNAKHIFFVLLIVGIFHTVLSVKSACATEGNEPSTGGLSAIFARETLADEATVDEKQSSEAGPALLLAGLLLLAASGKQYARQYALMNTELSQIQGRIDDLVNDSVMVDSTQSERLQAEFEGFETQRQQLVAEAQRLQAEIQTLQSDIQTFPKG